jgi:HlyD family secretion protein
MKKNFLIIIIIITSLLSCSRKVEKTNPASESITESIYASGIVKSKDQYQVFSPVNGLIQKIYVAEGDTVKKEQAIIKVTSETARLNTENAQLAADYGTVSANKDKLNEIQANINFLKSKKQNDSLLWEKQRNLWQQGIGTRNELDQRELSFKNDAAAYNAAIFRYNDLQKQLSFTAAQSKNNLQISKAVAGDFTVKSQVNGRVYSIAKEPGEMVTTQTPVAVIGAGNFMLELQVDEYDIKKIIPGLQVLVTMDSYKNKVYEAKVTRIIPFMNDRTRSFTVEAVFDTQPPALYPNLSVEANIVIQAKKNTITIPRDYLVDDSLVLMPGGKKKKVVTGLMDYQKVEIVSGLNTTDEIIKPVQ